MTTSKRAVTVYVPADLYGAIEAAAVSDGRSVSNFIERAMGSYLHVNSSSERPAPPMESRQVHLEDAIAAAVQRPPVRSKPKPRQGDECPCGSRKKYKHCHGRRP
jgi:hypothetical protein